MYVVHLEDDGDYVVFGSWAHDPQLGHVFTAHTKWLIPGTEIE
jgi:hypothetical protein